MLCADGVPITPMEKEIFPMIKEIQGLLDQYQLVTAECMVLQLNAGGYPGTFAIDWTLGDDDEERYLVSFEYPEGQSPYPQTCSEILEHERANPEEKGTGPKFNPKIPIDLN